MTDAAGGGDSERSMHPTAAIMTRTFIDRKKHQRARHCNSVSIAAISDSNCNGWQFTGKAAATIVGGKFAYRAD
jgi:hypothetical protein